MKCLADLGLGKGSVGNGARNDAELKRKLESLDLKDFLIEVPACSASCIDERVNADGKRVQFAKTAGGPLSLVYALRLSGIDRYASKNELELVDLVMDTLEQRGIAGDFAVHDDDHVGTCGCGACAKAHDVDNEIYDNFDAISQAAKALSDLPLAPVIRQSAQAMDTGFFADDRMEPIGRAQDDGAIIEDLVGDHDGQLIILNGTPNTTIDSVALREAQVHAFVVDHWVFPHLADIFTQNEEEKSLVVQSLLAFNVGTASVLCHEDIALLPISSR